jgi:hypothetical protein
MIPVNPIRINRQPFQDIDPVFQKVTQGWKIWGRGDNEAVGHRIDWSRIQVVL